jgi:hypothetical protein
MEKLTTFIFFILICSTTFCQLVTDNTRTPQYLVENVLMGKGVDVSNIKFTGTLNAIGSFDGSNSNLGLKNGIVITTGTVINNGDGPHGPNNKPNSGIDNNQPGYPKLTAQINGTPTYNAAVLEFDVVPQSDSISFNYIFGSEEYPEYANSEYNDVFAFYISGPGITGEKNIAIIPNTTLPVTINNVNNGQTNAGPCENCQYYKNNTTGTDQYSIQYDGFTTILNASIKVQCGQKYHLILAIADAGDGIFDSGIFLESNSLSSTLPVIASFDIDKKVVGKPKVITEDCSSATIYLERGADGSDKALDIPLDITGTATEGVDYNDLPAVIRFEPGETKVAFNITPVADGVVEGTESINLRFTILDPCGNEVYSFLDFEIEEINTGIITPSPICKGGSSTLEAFGGTDYLWTPASKLDDPTSPNPTATVDATTEFSVSITHFCGTDEYKLTLNVTEMNTSISNDTLICSGAEFPILATGGKTYSWSPITYLTDPNSANPITKPTSDINYTVTITDQYGCSKQQMMEIKVKEDLLNPQLPDVLKICPGESILIEAAGADNFYWYPNENIDTQSGNQVNVNPENDLYYYCEFSNSCRVITDSVLIDVRLLGASLYEDTAVCPGIPIQLKAYDGDNYEWWPKSYFADPTIPNPVVTISDTTDFMVYIRNQCNKDTL